MNQKKINIQLLKEWIHKNVMLTDSQKEKIGNWLVSCQDRMGELQERYNRICETDTEESTEEGITLSTEQWKYLLSGAIELLQPILPLGSVVELKKEELQKSMKELDKAKRVRIVITQRFLSYTEHGYFTYAGVAYPIGTLQKGEVLHFNPSMVQKAVHNGYEEEQETAYVSLMKQEYIIKKGKRSYEHAGNPECEKLMEVMGRQDDRRD